MENIKFFSEQGLSSLNNSEVAKNMKWEWLQQHKVIRKERLSPIYGEPGDSDVPLEMI